TLVTLAHPLHDALPICRARPRGRPPPLAHPCCWRPTTGRVTVNVSRKPAWVPRWTAHNSGQTRAASGCAATAPAARPTATATRRSEEHTSELQSRENLV